MADNRIEIVLQAVDKMSGDLKKVEGQLGKLDKGFVKASGSVAKVDEGFLAFSGTIKGIGAQIIVLNQAIGLIERFARGIQNLARPIVDVQIELDKMTRFFEIATGSAVGARAEMEFVRSEADRLGLSFSALASTFGQFSVAATESGFSMDQARDVFVATSEALTVMNADATTTRSVFLALEQMASRGAVSMEELRRQLGQRLPGAFALAAKAMGVTTQELTKMVESGELMAIDLLPKLAEQFRITFGPQVPAAASDMQSEIQRLNTALFFFFEALGRTGVITVFVTGLANMTGALERFGDALAQLGFAQESLEQRVGRLRREINRLQVALEASRDPMGRLDARGEALQRRIGDLQAELEGLTATLTAMREELEFSDLVETLLSISKATTILTEEEQELQEALQKQIVSLRAQLIALTQGTEASLRYALQQKFAGVVTKENTAIFAKLREEIIAVANAIEGAQRRQKIAQDRMKKDAEEQKERDETAIKIAENRGDANKKLAEISRDATEAGLTDTKKRITAVLREREEMVDMVQAIADEFPGMQGKVDKALGQIRDITIAKIEEINKEALEEQEKAAADMAEKFADTFLEFMENGEMDILDFFRNLGRSIVKEMLQEILKGLILKSGLQAGASGTLGGSLLGGIGSLLGGIAGIGGLFGGGGGAAVVGQGAVSGSIPNIAGFLPGFGRGGFVIPRRAMRSFQHGGFARNGPVIAEVGEEGPELVARMKPARMRAGEKEGEVIRQNIFVVDQRRQNLGPNDVEVVIADSIDRGRRVGKAVENVIRRGR